MFLCIETGRWHEISRAIMEGKMKRILLSVFVLCLLATGLQAEDGDLVIEGKAVTGAVNIEGGTLEIPRSTTLPAACKIGDIYMDTNAPSGQRCYLCESTNVWVLQADGAGRTATIVVAANGSSAISKAQADYVCDGTTDEAEIETAINALPSVGGRVVLLEGKYNIDTTIDLASNMILEGQGIATKIVATADMLGMLAVSSKTNVIIKNMLIDGNNAATFENGIGICKISSADYITIEEVHIQNSLKGGIWINGSSHITVRGCVVSDINKGGAVGYSGIRCCKTDNFIITENYIVTGGAGLGIGLCCPRNGIVTNNYIKGPFDAARGGIWIGHFYQDAYNVQISDNIIDNVDKSHYGIAFIGGYINGYDLSHVQISDNIIMNAFRGIGGPTERNTNGIISDVQIHDNIVSDSTWGIYFSCSGVMENFSVENNLLSDNINSIFISPAIDHTLIVTKSGNVGIGATSPNEKLTVEGSLSLDEITAPSATAGYGKVYVKSTDSKLYFKTDTGTEYDLTSGGGAVPTLRAPELNDSSDPILLVTAELQNTILSNINSVGPDEWDFPPRTEGWNFIFIKEADQNVTLDPYGTESWWFRVNDMPYVAHGYGVPIYNNTPGRSTVTCFSTESGVYCTGDSGWE